MFAVCLVATSMDLKNFQIHYRNISVSSFSFLSIAHGPVSRGEISRPPSDLKQLSAFSLVVVRRTDGRYLLVQVTEFLHNKFVPDEEPSSAGYWLPGGGMRGGENLKTTAINATKRKTGISIRLVGIMSFQFRPVRTDYCRLRVIFFAEPEEEIAVKSIPSFDSYGSCWIEPANLGNQFPKLFSRSSL